MTVTADGYRDDLTHALSGEPVRSSYGLRGHTFCGMALYVDQAGQWRENMAYEDGDAKVSVIDEGAAYYGPRPEPTCPSCLEHVGTTEDF